MSDGWITCTIDEIKAQVPNAIAMGPFGSRIKTENFVPSGVPVIRGVNLNSKRFNEEEYVFLTEEKADELSSANAFPGDIVFTHRGTLGQVGIIPSNSKHPRYVVSQSQMKLTCDSSKAYPLFVFYFFKSPQGQYSLLANTSTTGVPAISRPSTTLRKIEILLPPLEEQKAIAAVLGAFDDKIELNRQMNQTLEAIARAIFKSWFVDFDPVHAKARGQQPYGMDAETADLFPDSFEEVDGQLIPAGWCISTLGRIAKNPRRGVRPDELNAKKPYIGLQHMPQQSITLSDWGEAQEVSSNKYLFHEDEFLFGKLRPYFHKVGVAPLEGVCSTDILVILPNSESWRGLVLGHISSDEFVAYTTAISTGTRMPRANWNMMAKYGIVLPSESLAEAYTNLIQPMIQRIKSNIFESRTLAELRDTLLPRLVSGQLRVPKKPGFLLQEHSP